MTDKLADLLKVAQKASFEAGKRILEIYHTDFEVNFKEDTSPLTLADASANKMIMSYLHTTGIPIISEENQLLPYFERKHWDTFWLVDPLDGTKEFIKKNDEFTVNIALIKNGNPVLGVIYVPVKRELFYGTHQGAFKVENISNFSELNLAAKVSLKPKKTTSDIVVVVSRSHLSKETEIFINQIKEDKTINSVETIAAGSSLKVCMVAEGKADVYPRFAPTMEWDVAAGHAICNAAGVEVLNVDTGGTLEYNKENLLNPSFVVGDRFGSIIASLHI
ncbi:3'(2'),5'-bisphosphate nucleotidase CysQ [Flavobacteriaceae bacterium Ap0902]|nr:3'(2'),5'-bisphosphate nucleotidase CysQ [Flavobacteriaceae bacterium Ap0902]